MLKPIDIHNKEFKRSFRGYNEEETDTFLDQVVNDYEALWRENEQLKTELTQQKEAVAQYQKLEKNIKDTLLVAQKTAEEVTANARENAEKQLANAAKECQNMRRETELRAEKTKAEVDAKIKRRMAEATQQLQNVVSEYDRLVREKSLFMQHMQRVYEDELANVRDYLNQMPNSVHQKQAAPAQSAPQSEETAAATSTAAVKTTAVQPSGDAEARHDASQEG